MHAIRSSIVLFATVASTAVAATALAADAPWHCDLACPGGGYWHCRVPVTVTNQTGSDAVGRTVELRVGTGAGELALAGLGAAALRVCDAAGRDMLYDLVDAAGQPRRDGPLAAGDRLTFGVECANGSSATFYIYADNPQAWPVPDFLGAAAAFADGGFEEGADAPARWSQAEADAHHRLSWVTQSPHGGDRCARCDVDPAAEPSWVKWVQDGVGVAPDADYRFEAWVKAQDVKGSAGWFLHVHGEKPMAINRTLSAGEGTFEWRRVEATFHTPPDAVRATIGTVLRGTGTAWFDDAALTLLTKQAALRAVAGEVQRAGLATAPCPSQWRLGGASHRVELTVRNWGEAPARELLFASLGPLTRRLAADAQAGQIRIVDPASGEALPAVRTADRILFAADVPPRSEKTWHAYFVAPSLLRRLNPFAGRRRDEADFAALVASDANLVKNAGFEDGEALPSDWPLAAENDPATSQRIAGARDPDAHSGKWCARLDVPPELPLRWSGWRQGELTVKPQTTYLYAAWVRTRDVRDGSVQLHGHFHDAEGKLCQGTKYFSVGPSLAGTTDWTLLMGVVETPPDCASVQLHLTMNAHGTVWHDDVFFGEAAEALVGATQARRAFTDRAAARRGYTAWLANPIVKVFPDDSPQSPPRRIEVAAARGELEPFQLVLRSSRDLERVTIAIDTPLSDSGDRLPPVQINLVGYVPIDHPSSYYRVDVPAWYRKLPPRGQRGCDGWAGLWPDPLPPCRVFGLAAGKAQPVWATVRVPADAKPGVYRSSLAVQPANAPALRLPLAITVWDFALPRTGGLKVIYDFRPRSTSEEETRAWWKAMADHRICPGILPSPKFDYKDGKVAMDTSEFDRAAAYCLDELGMNVFYSPWFFYGFGWAHEPRKLFGFEPFSKEYEAAYTKCLEAFMAHLRARGWADRMILYISDEPHFDQPKVREQMIKLCEMIRRVEPKMPIYSSTWRYCPEWAGHINVWGAGPHGSFPVETMRERQQAGDTIWFTTDGHMCTDTPYCAIERLLPWLCWKYGVAAYEFWGVNWYTYDPWDVGWHRFISQSDDGVNYYYVRYPNGDGYLAYPGGRVGVEGPVSSIRLEQAREGIEDYEYLRLLDQLIGQAKERGLGTRGAERARADAAALVSIPNKGGLYSTSLLPDPDAVPRLRAAVARAIEFLSRRLR